MIFMNVRTRHFVLKSVQLITINLDKIIVQTQQSHISKIKK